MTVPSSAIAALFATTTLQAPEDAIGFLLWRVAHRYQREMDRAFAAIDLTHLQFVTLVKTAWLARAGAAVTQPALVYFSKIHPMQLSAVLKTLETKKLVDRPRSRSDVRIKHVVLTPAGLAVLAEALPLAEALQRRFVGGAVGQQLHTTLRQIVTEWSDDD